MKKGSEWIRVDLHVHTKGTKKNDQFSSKDMDGFYQLFFRKAFENNIKIIGITDYFNIENYERACEYLNKLRYDKNLSESESEFYKALLLIPNIELRIPPVTKKGKLINIHCLFSPSKIVELNDYFFSELKCDNHKMTKSGIISLGKQYAKNGSDEKCYNEGIKHFHITINDLKKVKEYFKDDMLIGISNSGTDGASGLNHKDFYDQELVCLEEIKRQIYKISDFIFSSSFDDREYFLGKKTSIEEVYTRCNGLKACFHGSDAHSEEKLFNPDLDRNCWIKSEISFEGIKQVIQEPESRIVIQKEIPEIKKDYNIIESISFDDEESGEEIKIYLNQNLNTIIGGKSTGKSMLLKNIVNSINSKYLEEKEVCDFKKLNNFKVNWKDKIDGEERNIEYIPQSYLNRQLNKPSMVSFIDETAEKIMLQNKNRKDKLEIFKEGIKQLEENASKLTDQYFCIEEKIRYNQEESKKIGGMKIVQNEIHLLTKQLKELQENSDIIEEEKKKINETTVILNKIDTKEKVIVEDIDIINNLIENENLFDGIYLKRMKNVLSARKSEAIKEIENILEDTRKKVISILGSIVEEWATEKKLAVEKKERLEAFINPYLEKIKNKNEIERIMNSLKNEKEKLEKIKNYNQENENYSSEQKIILQKIIGTFQEYETLYKETFSTQDWEESFNLLIIRTKYEASKNYWKDIYETLNGHSLRSHSEYSEDSIPNLDNLKNLFDLILKKEIKLKSSYSIPEVLKRLLKNPFILKYNITEKDNDINYMSEGNRSFVLLELLIHLDDNKYPILIDQPEDDLDNRSIYEDLVKFLREKKKDRQMIVVSHNANVVVGADSENVIVANQHGVGTENIKGIKFNYKNGGLENKDISKEGTLGKKNIQEHICEILEGGREAFEMRKKKYNFQ
ncbi:TrlF family AAA-like ATPase [Fusobacterium necrophorum subsp. funduliforme]